MFFRTYISFSFEDDMLTIDEMEARIEFHQESLEGISMSLFNISKSKKLYCCNDF